MGSFPTSCDLRDDVPRAFMLPDLVSHCTFSLSYHVNGDEVAQQSIDWLELNNPDLKLKQRCALRGLQAGKLAAYCYHSTTPERLRVISDFLTYLFHLDDISDGMKTHETDALADMVMNALWFTDKYLPTTKVSGKDQPEKEPNVSKLGRDFWARCIPDCGAGVQARFRESLGMFFEAVNAEARYRDEGVIPDLESYIAVRRDTSCCKPFWALIEYSLDIELPDFVIEHPVIEALKQGVNDFATWANDIFSYNVEQSRGDGHNMIAILMHDGYTLQGAVDYVGDQCKKAIDTFLANKAEIPSWGPHIDDMVRRYVQCLQDWIVGPLHFSFQTDRYFDTEGLRVKEERIVELLPLRREPLPECTIDRSMMQHKKANKEVGPLDVADMRGI